MASFTNNEVTLISGDGEEFKVPANVVSLSTLAAGMIVEDEQDEEQRIPLPNVRREILAKVLEFCHYYNQEKMSEFVKPLQNADLTALVQPFYSNFINSVDKEMLFNLTLAANYLDIKPLLDLCCAKIASMIKNKTPEEIRVNLDIVNDFSPEEEAQLRSENKWVEE